MSVQNALRAYAMEYDVFEEFTDLQEAHSEKKEARIIAKKLREKGIPVQAYQLQNEDQLSKLEFPFLIKHLGEWKLIDPSSDDYLGMVNKDEEGNPIIVGEPPVGVTFEMIKKQPDNSVKIYIFYAATNDSPKLAHEQVFTDIERILEAKEENTDILFMDALGLIPEETVINQPGQNRRERFEEAFEGIKAQTANIENGVPPKEYHKARSPFWNEVWEFLAQRKVRSVLEELQFELWEKIIDFDNKKLVNKAFQLAYYGWPEQAAETMAGWKIGFHKRNCLERNGYLSNQINQLIEKSGKPLIILMAKEIGHYGVLESLLSDYTVYSKIIGHRKFRTLLKVPPLDVILDNMEVRLSEDTRKLLALKQCLKGFIQARIGDNLRKSAEIFEKTHIDELTYKQITHLLEDLHSPERIYLRQVDNQKLEDQLIYLLRNKGIISTQVMEKLRGDEDGS